MLIVVLDEAKKIMSPAQWATLMARIRSSPELPETPTGQG
jgi:hypothetical protein